MGEMKVLRGKKNFKDVGHVLAFNGDTGEMTSFCFNFFCKFHKNATSNEFNDFHRIRCMGW